MDSNTKEAVHQTGRPLADVVKKPRRSFKGFREVQEEQRRKRARRTKPPPWIVRKLAVIVIVGLIIFATYVYVGRACLPLIRDKPDVHGGGKGVGVAFLCIYWLLWIMCIWTYGKIVLTPPGFARDYIEKSAPPESTGVAGPRYTGREWDAETDGTIDPHDYDTREQHPQPPTNTFDTNLPLTSTEPSDGPSLEHGPTNPLQSPPNTQAREPDDMDVTELDAFPGIKHIRAPPLGHKGGGASADCPSAQPGAPAPPSSDARSGVPAPANARQPPRHPVLAPEYRYCQRDGFVKPFRTHHCRICATCVLNFDHHCPWIGHCVGARNRKYFMNFVLWGCLYCSWISLSLIALQAQNSGSEGGIDALQIIVIALTGIFGLFTFGLFLTHTYLIMLNLSTIEDYSIQSMKERESYVLSSMFPWWNIRARIRTRRTWDEEWGALKTEGNIWWLGSRRRNLEQVMGQSRWGWFLPIGKGDADGLDYQINPRFTPDGRWRRRSEWDPSLR